MSGQQNSTSDSISYGLLGCLGGLLLGIGGGMVGLILLALLIASQTMPANPPAAAGPDLRLTLQEGFLNRLAQSSTGQPSAQVDILPGNQIRLAMAAVVSVSGLTVPVQVVALFGLQATGQSIQVSLMDVQVSGLTLTPQLRELLSGDLPALNQDLNRILTDISTALEMPIVLTGLGTTETELWFEVREKP